jgi:hypothetical protein
VKQGSPSSQHSASSWRRSLDSVKRNLFGGLNRGKDPAILVA